MKLYRGTECNEKGVKEIYRKAPLDVERLGKRNTDIKINTTCLQ